MGEIKNKMAKLMQNNRFRLPEDMFKARKHHNDKQEVMDGKRSQLAADWEVGA